MDDTVSTLAPTSATPQTAPPFARRYLNLAGEGVGARVLHCTDEFFAKAQRMLQDGEPLFIADKFDDHGKWMDGWETRRRRQGGHDTATVRLGIPGVIKGVDIDTRHFTGNFPPAAKLEACYCPNGAPAEHQAWTVLLDNVALEGNRHHYLPVDTTESWTHVRLNIYPDGGVARLRVFGQPVCDPSRYPDDALCEVSALENGGRLVAYSDAHYGVPFRLLAAGRGVNMGDGWETRRRREPGNDWCIVQLGHLAIVERIEVDTAHFKGNYPDRVSLQAAQVTIGDEASIVNQAMFWPELLPERKVGPDAQHFFEDEDIRDLGPVNTVKLNVFPDGGVSRLRIWGRLARDGAST